MTAHEGWPTPHWAIDPDVDLVGHMTQIKYPATREFVSMLKDTGVRALHVEGPVLDDLLGGGMHYYNDVACVIRESDLARFWDAMRQAGYKAIWDHADTGTAVEASQEWMQQSYPPPINGFGLGWSKEVKWPSDLWICFGTTWRHWELTLVDLEHWFGDGVAETVTVMGDVEIERPPSWGLLLFELDRLAMKARSHTARRDHVELLRSIADRVDWQVVGERAEAYSREYIARAARASAILAEIPSGEPPQGNLHYHGLRCLEDYYPGTVPAQLLARLEPLASPLHLVASDDAERGIEWSRDFEEYQGAAPFGIKELIENYGHLSPVELFAQGVVPNYEKYPLQVATDASIWKLTEDHVKQIYAPLS
jgi:hypothetical protein